MSKIPTGMVYRRKYKDKDGNQCETSTYYVQYYVKGRSKPVIKSTGTTDYEQAVAFLRQKMARAALQVEHTSDPDRVLVGQLLDLLVDDYKLERRRSTDDMEKRVDKHLRPFFASKKVHEVTTTLINRYRSMRVKKAAAATVNKEVSYLRRAFKLGLEHTPPLVEKAPVFKMFELDNAREGTLAHEAYRSVRDSLPSYARIALVISYHTGSRKGEIRKIRLQDIDLAASRINIPSKNAKNKTPRYLPIYGDMQAELEMAMSLCDPRCPYLIQNEGKPVGSWRKSWKTACRAARVDAALFHDLRRTALTNMIEAGYSEKEAMLISGHKTRHVFDRYCIVSSKRLKEQTKKLEAFMAEKEAKIATTTGKVQ